MDDLDDIRYAVIDNDAGDYEVLGFFKKREHADLFAKAISECPDGTPLQVLSRNDGEFYIDIRADISSSFDIRP